MLASERPRSKPRVNSELASDFAHDAEGVAGGIVEECHPQIVVGHSGDEVRLPEKRDAAGFDGSTGGVDVVDLVIEDGASARLLFLRSRQHEANFAALEEGKVAGFKEEFQTEGVLVEVFGLREVVDGERDLSDGVEGDGCRGDAAVGHEFLSTFVSSANDIS